MKIENKSDADIVWLALFEEMSDINTHSYTYWQQHITDYMIPKYSTGIECFSRNVMQSYLKKGWRKYYLFSYDSIKSIPWERIRNERIILKEKTFYSWEDMENHNFKITYSTHE
jgi:hypothetical protein